MARNGGGRAEGEGWGSCGRGAVRYLVIDRRLGARRARQGRVEGEKIEGVKGGALRVGWRVGGGGEREEL